MNKLTFNHQIFGPTLRAKVTVRGDCSTYNDAVKNLYEYERLGMSPDETRENIIRLRDENTNLREALKGAMVVAETAKGLKDENARLRAELEAAKQQIKDSAMFLAIHGAGGYVLQTHANDVPIRPANCGEQGAPFDEPMGGGEG